MKRVLAVLFVVALAFTMVSGCASTQDVQKCQEMCSTAMNKAQTIEQQCATNARAAEAASQKAEAAARRAEAAADKAESIFQKNLRK